MDNAQLSKIKITIPKKASSFLQNRDHFEGNKVQRIRDLCELIALGQNEIQECFFVSAYPKVQQKSGYPRVQQKSAYPKIQGMPRNVLPQSEPMNEAEISAQRPTTIVVLRPSILGLPSSAASAASAAAKVQKRQFFTRRGRAQCHFASFSGQRVQAHTPYYSIIFCTHLQRSAKRRGCLLSYSQAEPRRELTQPSPRLLAEPCTFLS